MVDLDAIDSNSDSEDVEIRAYDPTEEGKASRRKAAAKQRPNAVKVQDLSRTEDGRYMCQSSFQTAIALSSSVSARSQL